MALNKKKGTRNPTHRKTANTKYTCRKEETTEPAEAQRRIRRGAIPEGRGRGRQRSQPNS
jgi:hypothetical protein